MINALRFRLQIVISSIHFCMLGSMTRSEKKNKGCANLALPGGIVIFVLSFSIASLTSLESILSTGK